MQLHRADLTHELTTTAVSANASYGIAAGAALTGRTAFGYERLGSAFDVIDSVPLAYSRIHVG